MSHILSFLAATAAVTTAGAVLAAQPEVSRKDWGADGTTPVSLFRVTNVNGMVLEMTDFGARIVSLHVPDRDGNLEDVVLGFDSLAEYQAPNPSFGATIGRYSNRVRDARFEIDGVSYELSKNEGENNLHGGGEFEYVTWDSEAVSTESAAGVRFHYVSPDGSQGFPGRLESTVTYLLTDENAVEISFEATTDHATHVNFTQHSYFNLNGANRPVFDHRARIHASEYLVMDGVLATGTIEPLEGKPWDLTQFTRLGDHMQDIPLGGYHHNYVADKPQGELALVAEVLDPESGRTLAVSTTQPGVVFYAAMGLPAGMRGKNGLEYGPYMAFCLETQHPIDAANHPNFPSTLLRPGGRYHEVVIYDFGVSE